MLHHLGTQNAGQHIANGVNDLTSTFAELTAEPIKLLKDAVKDKVRLYSMCE